MKKQDKNRLSKKDRRLIKKAMLKAAAKGSDEGLQNRAGFERRL